MKKIALAVFGACLAAGAQAGAPDWSKVAERKIKVFYPGQSALEWVMNQSDHSAVPDIVNKKRPCAKCHEGDANEIGDKIVAGKPVGHPRLEFLLVRSAGLDRGMAGRRGKFGDGAQKAAAAPVRRVG